MDELGKKKRERELMNMDNSLVIARGGGSGRGYRRDKMGMEKIK